MEDLIEQMKVVLGTAFAFYLKTHNFHWNVTGPNFAQYHEFLNDVYDQVWADVDKYAEHIRALDSYAPGSLTRFRELSKISDEVNIPSGLNMMSRLESDNNIVRQELIRAHDLATAQRQFGLLNFLEDRLDYHDKLHWMLKAFNA